MPRRINMRHHMDGPTSRERLVGVAAGILRQRIEAAADAGIGAKQRDRAEQPLGFLDDVDNVFLLRDIAFERRAVDRAGHRSRAGGFLVGNDHLGSTGAMKGLAERPPDAVGAASDNHDFSAHLHGETRVFEIGLRREPDRARPCSDRPRRAARTNARSRSGTGAFAMRERLLRNYRAGHRQQ